MSQYKKNPPISSETVNDAMKIARATQKPNQSKEQTKLIAQGIQKGIAEYKKQYKAKTRELNKQKKKLNQQQTSNVSSDDEKESCKIQWLPWILLLLTWLAFSYYVLNF